ncbi:unnamed protein product [Moneuplotes crassus]|uniref:Uncharacterized protein n=1 Tax=Euplotes crassus TaxID=5936 RepID=A0AAD1Y674_EUPCR|nr:unnamed protein product [Moneuplotes crassus]|mmetsp:Transcript_7803/g.7370  ORF Transcript_7803/g.7370 Transcript_7803/m.7370 type:complete len:123 (-) Transcript_7803:5-373(-)
MGIPPKRNVMHKLITKYFRVGRNSPPHPEAVKYQNQLINCWERYGVNNPKCSHLIEVFDYGWGLNLVKKDKFTQQLSGYTDLAMKPMDLTPKAAKKRAAAEKVYWAGYQRGVKDPLRPPTLY